MTALELAEELELPYWNDGTQHGQLVKAAAMLRRQHEAIVKLREAISQSQECVSWPHTAIAIRDALEKALKDTEGL